MIVIAVDQPARGQPMTGTATVSVIVTDVNDNAPTFRDISYEKSIFENHPLGSNILTVSILALTYLKVYLSILDLSSFKSMVLKHFCRHLTFIIRSVPCWTHKTQIYK